MTKMSEVNAIFICSCLITMWFVDVLIYSDGLGKVSVVSMMVTTADLISRCNALHSLETERQKRDY